MLTVSTILNGAFGLVRERIAAIGVWALIYFAISVALVFVMRPFMLEMAAMQHQVGSGGTAPAGLFAGFGKMFLAYLAALAVLLVLYTAALRAKFNPGDEGFAYLRLGADEARILGVGVVLVIAFMVLYLMLVIVLAILGAIVGMTVPALVIPVTLLAILVVFAVLVYFQVRLSLAFALTLLRGKMVIGESWRLTRGRFWTLFGGYFVLGLIVLAVSLAVAMVTQGQYLMEMMRAGTDPAARAVAQQHQLERQFVDITPLTMLGWVLSALVGAVWIALSAGAVGSATLGLLDEDYGEVGIGYVDPAE